MGCDTLHTCGCIERIAALESRLAEMEGERDALAANGPAIVAALEERNVARAERDELQAALDRIAEVVGALHDQSMGPSFIGTPAEILERVQEVQQERHKLIDLVMETELECASLRGDGCDEDGDGPCGACIKCARAERDGAIDVKERAQQESATACGRMREQKAELAARLARIEKAAGEARTALVKMLMSHDPDATEEVRADAIFDAGMAAGAAVRSIDAALALPGAEGREGEGE